MHPIKRIFLIGLFSFGTVAGFGHGFAHLGSCHANRRAAFEDRVADVCTRSAERAWEGHGAMNAPPPPAPYAPPAPSITYVIAAPGTLTLGATVPAAVVPAAPPAVAPAAATPALEAPAAP